MRQGPHSKRGRGRNNNNNNNRKQVPLRHQTFDSNGPDVRIRGNANQVFDKYSQLARDAMSSGDRIKAENYYQHAEHYLRIIHEDEEHQRRIQEQRQQEQAQRFPDGEEQGEQPAEMRGDDEERGDRGGRRRDRFQDRNRRPRPEGEEAGQESRAGEAEVVATPVEPAAGSQDDLGLPAAYRPESSDGSEEEAKPARRGRGRPRKSETDEAAGTEEAAPKRGRGRPRKVQPDDSDPSPDQDAAD